jgi:hypothetical protein
MDCVIILYYGGSVNEQFELICMRRHFLTFEKLPQFKELVCRARSSVASGPGTMRQRNMNSYFTQREGGRLYGTARTDQQEYGAEFELNGSKPSVANPKRIFLTSLVKSASKLSSTFHTSPSEGCTMSPSFSRMSSLCHLICLTVLLEINNRFKRGVIGK